jgi:hypothetical protein
MVKKSKVVTRIATAILGCSLVLSGCPNEDTAEVTGVTLEAVSSQVEKGGTLGFSARVEGTGNYSGEVRWSVSSNESQNTKIESVNGNTGLLTVGADETAKTLWVTATSTANEGKSAAASVTVLPPPLSQGGSLADKLAWLASNAESSGDYILEIEADEGIEGSSLSYGGKENIRITLRGKGANRTVSLNDSGTLFTVGAGVTLILDSNITLQGTYRSLPLVRVGSGGSLEMHEGAGIASDGSSSMNGGVHVQAGGTFTMNGGSISGGGSVSVWDGGTFTMNEGSISGGYGVGVQAGGTFIMEGGTISDNTVGSGGVFVRGTFTMRGGSIRDNTVVGSDKSEWYNDRGVAGGVLVWGTFIMEGGTISGNTAGSSERGAAGGVSVSQGGTFTMEGGNISGNTADYGGGVLVKGTFTMRDGSISGNTTSSGSGGGVHIGWIERGGRTAWSGSFTMEGGTISGNTASYYGGGVFVRGGRYVNHEVGYAYESSFTMKGGSISGNTATRSGGGVYVSSGEDGVASGRFEKTGGTIYGYTEGDSNSNKVVDDSGAVVSGLGHAVHASQYSNSINWEKYKDTTAGPGDNFMIDGKTFSGEWDN